MIDIDLQHISILIRMYLFYVCMYIYIYVDMYTYIYICVIFPCAIRYGSSWKTPSQQPAMGCNGGFT